MGYRAMTRAGTALLLAVTPHFSAFAQSGTPAAPATSSPTTVAPSIVPVLNPAAQAALQRTLAGNQRIEPTRDRWRNPAATLQFFGVRPTDTVIEVWPGEGWYTSILGPYLKQGGGNLVAGHFDAASTNSTVVRQIVEAYRARFAGNQGVYGSVGVVPFGPMSGALGAPGSADSVVTFRNVHNWMAQGWAEKAFGDFFLVLKPGGILGIEEHRGRTDEPQDPLARDGYVREDFVIQLAREAGFDFVGRSEINANPADTKDHPFGVWTLPPVSRSSPLNKRDDPGFDRTRYDAIGESDRMTLRFRKPMGATGAPPPAGTRWAPVIVAPAPPPPPQRPTPAVVRPPISRPVVVAAPAVVPAIAGSRPVAPVVAPVPAPISAPAASKPTVPVPVPVPVPGPAAPTPATPTLSPPGGPPINSGTATNSEAVAPRSVEATPVPRPSADVTPPPAVVLAPASPAPAPAPTGAPIVETKPLAPLTPPVAPVGQPVPPVATPTTSLPPVAPPTAAPTPPPPPAIQQPATSVRPDPAVTPRPAPTRPDPARPDPVKPQPVQPAPEASVRPIVPATTTRPRPAPQTRPVVRPTPAAPAATRPAVARPAPVRPSTAPLPKAKAKATPPAAQPRPPSRPTLPPAAKKTAPPPRVDPNKPDWIVPRRRS